MINPKNGWIEMMIQSAVATLVFAAVAMGCATPEAPSGATARSMVRFQLQSPIKIPFMCFLPRVC